jgi:hypothetical protein
MKRCVLTLTGFLALLIVVMAVVYRDSIIRYVRMSRMLVGLPGIA